MTRKRFVKLLMAAGYDRNEANAIAADARSRGIEYNKVYIAANGILTAGIKWNGVDIDAVCDGFRKIVDAAQKVAQAVCNAAAAFTKAFLETMEATNE